MRFSAELFSNPITSAIGGPLFLGSIKGKDENIQGVPSARGLGWVELNC